MCFRKLKSHSSISHRFFLFATILFISLTPAAQASLTTDPPSASAPASAEGVLDEIQISGSDLKVRGWAGAGDSANPVTGIRLLVDGVEIYSGGFEKQPRPDVAQAKGRSDWAQSGLLLQAHLKNPLPAGPRKFTATALLKNGDHFDLRVPEESVSLGLATPVAQPSLLGQLDEVVLEGGQLKVRGWAAWPNSGQKPQVILLKSGEETLYQGEFQIEERPDVATALSKPDLVNSGWIVRLDWSGKPAPSSITPHFEMQTGEILSLPLPITAQAKSAHPAPPAPSEELMGTRLAWLAAFLLAGGVGVVVYRAYQRRGNFSQPHDLASPPLRITDWPTFFILAGVFFSIFASKLFLIAHFGSGIPFWDQWDAEAYGLLVPFLEGRLGWGDLLAPHNEHRIMLTRLFVLGLFLLNGQWDPLLEMVAQAALHAGVLAFFVALCRSFLRQCSWIGFALLTVLIYCIPFSYENTLWGFQSQFYFATLCGLCGIWLTWRFAALSKGWLAGWGFFVVGLFTMGSAFLAVVAAFGVALVRLFFDGGPRFRAALSLGAYAIVVISGLLLIGYNPGHEPLKAHGAGDFFRFFFQLVAWPTELPVLGLFLHLSILALAVVVLLRRPPPEDTSWFLATLGCWNFLGMAALAYGRANSDLASRYTDSLAFGILVSLASALWFCSCLTGKWRLAAQMLFVVQVASVAGGLLYAVSGKLCEDFIAKKELEPIQAHNLMAFSTTDDVQSLTNKPHLHIPYPSATRLAQILRVKKLREVLPSAVHRGLSPIVMSFNENNFIKNGGVYPTTKPANPRLHFGSFTAAGDLSTGEMRLDFPATQSAAAFQLLVAGYPLKESMRLVLETPDGKQRPIQVRENPKETWHEVIFPNPGTAFSILAADDSAKTWLAFSQPVPIGRLSIWTKWLLANLWIFGAAGAGCFVAGFLFSYTENKRIT